MARKEVLGKGIHALIAEYPQDAAAEGGTILHIALDNITPNPHQPRSDFDGNKLSELAQSIREKGLIQPVIVNRVSLDNYHLIAGERRWRAAGLAGYETIPAIVHEIDSEQELMELALIENVQRADLNPIEEAEAYRSLISSCLLTQEDVANRVGKDRSTIANALRLLKLPPEIRGHLKRGEIQMGHARTLVSLEADVALELGQRCVRERMSVRELEKAARSAGVAGRKRRKKRGGSTVSDSDPLLVALEEKLRHRYATGIAIQRGGRKGRVEIEFYSDDDLERLLDLLLRE